jgi:ABC-type oligopeptide transport system substrate-binding subunit
MARRTLRTGLLAGTLALALIASGCGDSKDDTATTTGKNGGNKTSEKLATADCGTLKYNKDAPSGGTFTDYSQLSSNADNTTFDPATTQTLAEAQITTAMWDGLLDFDFTKKCSPVLKGLIADKWTANSDATEWTFHLKDGYVFSNGEKVLPHNFKQGWERAGSSQTASPYGYLINNIEGGALWNAGCKDDPAPAEGQTCKDPVDEKPGLPAIKADDKAMTLTVKLSAPNADFPAITTHQFFMPISDADYARVPRKGGWGNDGATIGNGPFMLDKDGAPGPQKDVTLVPNPKWKGNVYGDTKVKLDKIIFKSTADLGTAYQAFESGDGDDAPIPPGKYGAAQAAYKNNTVDDPNLGAYYFDIGHDDKVLGGEKNVELRKAVSLAIDREEINKKVYEGTRTTATGITPPGIPGFKKDLCKFCGFDKAAAKQHYDTWKTDSNGGKDLTETLKIEYNPGGGHDQVALVIKNDLKKYLGIDAKLDPIPETYFRDIVEPGACEICRSGWYADYPTYGNFMVDLFSKASIGGNNFGRYDNPDFEAKIKAAQAETDSTKRGELYQEAEDILLNKDVNAIPINWYTGATVFRDTVENNDQPPLGLYLWERMAKTS